MLRQILDVLFTFYQIVLVIYLLQKQIPTRKHSIVYEIAAVSAMSFYVLGIQYAGLNLPDWLGLLVLPFYIKCSSGAAWKRCIFWSLLDSFLYYGTLTLVSYFFPVQIALNGSATAADEVMILYVFIGNIVLTLVITTTAHLCSKRRSMGAESLLFILMLGTCFVINECFFQLRDDETHQLQLLLGSACSFFLMLCTMVLYEHLTDAKQKQHMAEMSLQTSALVSDYQRELKTVYTHMLAQQHDLRHRVTVAEELLAASELPPEARQKLLQYLTPESPSKVYITGNTAVDAILMAKSSTMQHAGIPFTFLEYPLPELPLSETDFCILLGNLLDNAIEGTLRLPDRSARYVKLRFLQVWDTLLISCVNSANEYFIRRDGDTFQTSKDHPEIHGFGMRNMIRIVDSANGILEFFVENGIFRVEITLGYPKHYPS